jgi:hypothetical protein
MRSRIDQSAEAGARSSAADISPPGTGARFSKIEVESFGTVGGSNSDAGDRFNGKS